MPFTEPVVTDSCDLKNLPEKRSGFASGFGAGASAANATMAMKAAAIGAAMRVRRFTGLPFRRLCAGQLVDRHAEAPKKSAGGKCEGPRDDRDPSVVDLLRGAGVADERRHLIVQVLQRLLIGVHHVAGRIVV